MKTTNSRTFRSNVKLIDYWSIPHFLFGAVTALASVVFSVPGRYGFISTFLIAIAWELFEKKAKLWENIRNVSADIALPLISFPVVYYYAMEIVSDAERNRALFVVVTILHFFINFIAWRARSERDRDFMP
ncbi:MAG: hypothetical protein HGB34_02685 [Candidatus Moranbacteria bacterium]|nr:hypothetical protein [Candidatus Moranbacteria bacterium]